MYIGSAIVIGFFLTMNIGYRKMEKFDIGTPLHYNNTLPDRSKCYRGRFYRDLAIKPSLPSSPSLLRWKFILGEQIDKYVRRTIPALRNII